ARREIFLTCDKSLELRRNQARSQRFCGMVSARACSTRDAWSGPRSPPFWSGSRSFQQGKRNGTIMRKSLIVAALAGATLALGACNSGKDAADTGASDTTAMDNTADTGTAGTAGDTGAIGAT